MTGTSIAQAIPIAISPILTRIYTPEDFGVFALYIGVASIVAVMATGRYELAIMLPKKDEDAIQLVILSILISFCISLIAFLLVYFFNGFIVSFLGNEEISNWLYLIPITVFFTGIYQSLNYWNNRKKRYKRLATSRVIQSGTTATSNLSMGFGGFGSSGLILSGVLGQGVATVILSRITWLEHGQRFEKIKSLKIFSLIKKYRKFPIFNLPNALIDALRLSGISILIAKFFSTATLGQFSLAWKMIQAPITLIGGSISQVFFQKIASAKRTDLDLIVKRFLLKASVIALPIFIMLYLFATDLFAIVFGENWKLAGEIASILTPWLFFNFLTTPMANVFIVLNRQEVVLLVSIFYMLTPISILVIFNELEFLYLLNIITVSMSSILLMYIGLLFFYIKKEKNVV